MNRICLLHVLLFALLGACRGAQSRCSPLQASACQCDDGRSGSQRCLASGRDYAECTCDADAGVAAARDAAIIDAPQGGQSSAGTLAGSSGTRTAGAGAGGNRSDGGAGALAGSGGTLAPLGGTLAAGSGGSTAPELVTEPADEAAFLFDGSQLRTYDIVVAPADLAQIDMNPALEQLVPASLEYGGQSYGPFQMRYKGAAGSFKYPCTTGLPGDPRLGKCSIKLDFNGVDPNARFFGLKKLNFHSMNADGSQLRDRLAYTLFREMGVAAPRAVHARVLINGQLQGVFAVVEQIDGRFTRARFGEGGQGNLYKEVWPMFDDAPTYTAALEASATTPPSVQRMLDFKAAIASSADATAAFLDRDYLMRYLAVDRVIANDDGCLHLWCNDGSLQGHNPGMFGNHNYYWYEEVARARLWLVPWDLDKTFADTLEVHIDPAWTASAACACTDRGQAGMQYPASCDPFVQRVQAWLPSYEAQVDAFLAGPFAKSHVDSLLDSWVLQLQAATAEAAQLGNHSPSESEWADAVTVLRARIDDLRTHRGYAY